MYNKTENPSAFRVNTATNILRPAYASSSSQVSETVLRGYQGPMGEIGYDGEDGPQGCIGPQGLTGLTGLQGPQGEAGSTGLMGLQGPQGEAGLMGLPGLPGPKGEAQCSEGVYTDTEMMITDMFTTLVNMKIERPNVPKMIFVSVCCEGNTGGDIVCEFKLLKNGETFNPSMMYTMKKGSGYKVINLQFVDNVVTPDEIEYMLQVKGKQSLPLKILNSSMIIL